MKEDKHFELKDYHRNDWYDSLSPQGKLTADLILKHSYLFKKRVKRCSSFVYITKISIFFFTMCSTIILGINFFPGNKYQITIGLILSAVIAFITALSSFFNLEKYWMRNKAMDIKLDIIRDNFIFDVKSEQMDNKQLKKYIKMLEDIQNNNINYWENAILEKK